MVVLRCLYVDYHSCVVLFQASILYKSIAGRYRPVSYPDGPITAHYRFIKNAFWGYCLFLMLLLSTPGEGCASFLSPFSRQFDLTPSALQTKLIISVDPDEMAYNELYHLDLQCLPFCFGLRLPSILVQDVQIQ